MLAPVAVRARHLLAVNLVAACAAWLLKLRVERICAAPWRRKSPRRDFRGRTSRPGVPDREKAGDFRARSTRTRSSLIGLKAGEAVRQSDASVGGGVFADALDSSLAYRRCTSALPLRLGQADLDLPRRD